MKNIRVCLLLLVFTVVICSVLYPLVLLGVGKVFFPTQAEGSLIVGKDKEGKEHTTGSSLIGQPFTSDTYFYSRPSATSPAYNATASGASNYGASNPKLRDRVAQQLGTMIQYKKTIRFTTGLDLNPRTPQMDMDDWFIAIPDRAAQWAKQFEFGPANWAKTDQAGDKYGLQGKYIMTWAESHPEIVATWKKAKPSATDEPKPEDLASEFFVSFASAYPSRWPGVVEKKNPDGTLDTKVIEPVKSDDTLHATLFDAWISDPANAARAADLQPVAADMVLASGSGLDPHITLRNALSVYQLDRVAASRTPEGIDGEKLKQKIADLAKSQAFTPLSGFIGEPLVNVLELNVELDRRFPVPPGKTP